MADSKVTPFYANKSIFITGATGFVGKVLVEKLLRSCPDIRHIYLLLRKKRGCTPEDRIKSLTDGKLFDVLRSTNPASFSKLRVIAGDILEDELGISNEDRAELQRECHIVFHSAACVRFDQPLKEAVQLNTVGTIRVLKLAENMDKLDVFVHLSTAYCRCELPQLEEKIYPAQHPPQKVIEMVSWMDDELLQLTEPNLISPEPNTYAYTKAMTEAIVAEYAHKFPIAITRPSIITSMWKEPIPGWVDNLNGPTGLLVGAGKGVIRSMHCNASLYLDALPVDVIVNGCILAAYVTATEKPKTPNVYNQTLSGEVKLTWAQMIDLGKKWVNAYPMVFALWYPGGSPKKIWLIHQISVFLFQIVPAYLADILLSLVGKKPFLVKIQERISHGIKILQYYTNKQWVFLNSHYISLRNKVPAIDNKTFYTSVDDIDMDKYMEEYILGARVYCCKEDLATLPKAKKIHRIRYVLDIMASILFYALLAWLMYRYSGIFASFLQFLDSALMKTSPFKTTHASEID